MTCRFTPCRRSSLSSRPAAPNAIAVGESAIHQHVCRCCHLHFVAKSGGRARCSAREERDDLADVGAGGAGAEAEPG